MNNLPQRTLVFLAAWVSLQSTAPGGAYVEQVKHLDDPDVFAAVVAGGVGAIDDLAGALDGSRPDLAIAALGKIGLPAATPHLVSRVDATDAELRAGLAQALGASGGDEATAALVRLSSDASASVRVASIAALARVSDPSAQGALRAGLKDAVVTIRLAAVRAVQAKGSTDLAPALLPMLDYQLRMVPANPVAGSAPGANGAAADGRLVEQVAWAEPSDEVRLGVIRAFGAMKYFDALPALIVAMERETTLNRLAIIDVIRSMGDQAASVCIGRIVPLSYDKDAFEKYMPLLINNGTLAVIAGQGGDERAVPYLLETLKLPRQKIGSDRDLTELYIQTINLLGRFKVVRAARPLVEILAAVRVKEVSQASQSAIRAIGHSAARPLAAAASEDWQLAPILFPLLREPELRNFAAREAILKYLSHESDGVRLEATETLGLYLREGILDEYDMPMLEAMYLDANREVRASCQKWTQEIAMKRSAP